MILLKLCKDRDHMRFVPVDQFWVSRNGRTRDGLKGTCKECSKARRKASVTPEQAAVYNRINYERNGVGWVDRFRIHSTARRARRRNAFVENVSPIVVLERADGVCGICDADVDPLNFHVDHIIPLAHGGEHSYANTQPAHPTCNRRKGARI
jgi:5-methylcytosine-specific restriction endonuclease McrA